SKVAAEDCNLLMSQGFKVIKTISSGTYGRVYHITHPELGEVAAKVVDNEKFDLNEWNVAGVMNQESIQMCPYIIQKFLAKQFESSTVLLMNYANLKPLTSLVRNSNEQISINLLRVIMYQLLQGVRILHSANLVHGNLNLDNILMHCSDPSKGALLKIAGFSVAQEVSKDKLVSSAGILQYKAPELLTNDKRGNNKIDRWSVGLIMFELKMKRFPFHAGSLTELKNNIGKVIPRPTELITAEQEEEMPISGYDYNKRDSNQDKDHYWSLLLGLLQRDPQKRVSAESALRHPFFSKTNMPPSQKLIIQVNPIET
ncbi:MAG: putative CMGC/CDK/CDK7 protein kinase, partial [Streblomastix strix]